MPVYRGIGTADAATTTTNVIVRETFTATSGQTVFNITGFVYTPGSNQTDVYVEGVKQLLTVDYVETDSDTITFVSGVTLNEVVEIEAIIGGSILDTQSAANIVFTHSTTGAVQSTVDAALKAQNLDTLTELKVSDGAQLQRADVRGQFTASDGLGGRYYWDKDSVATDTSATSGNVVAQTGVTTGRWVRVSTNVFSGAVFFAGVVNNTDLTESLDGSTGSFNTLGGIGATKNIALGGDLVMLEKADHSSTPVAGSGYLWVKSTIPATLFFTDDAGSDTDLSAAGGTVTVANEATDTTTFPLFATAATGALSAKSNAGLTFDSSTAMLTATGFTGPLTGNADTATSAVTVTQAAQTAITSLGTLTILDVDNLRLDGNSLISTAGTDLLITPLAGQQIVLDSTIVIDADVIYNADDVSSITLAGGGSSILGANIILYGGAHANTGDMVFNNDANTWMLWDETVGDLEILTGIGAKTAALTLDASQNATFGGDLLTVGNIVMANATIMKLSGDNSRLIFAGGSSAATGQGAFIIVEGDDYAGTNLGGSLILTAGDNAASTIDLVGDVTLSAAIIGSAGNEVDSGLFSIKAADEEVTSSTTLQNDDDLVLTLAASTTYLVSLFVLIEVESINPDFKYGLATTDITFKGWMDGPQGRFDQYNGNSIGNWSMIQTVFEVANFEIVCITGVTGGDFQFQWAQNVSHADWTRVLKGSWIKAVKIA